VLILINGCLLKQFNFLNAKLSDLANGEKEVDVAELKKLNDEIGLMAKSIDMINEKLHPKLAKKGSSQKQKIKTADIVVQPKKNKSKIDVSSTQKLSVDDMNTNPEDE